ncbi:MAG: hypothetical protein JWM70_5 [Microbacteriaceae bacterium]|nr:hypothetical protein [Microbacteriaceae bacterium]
MTCSALASTGLEFVPTLVLLLAAVGLPAVGILLLSRRRFHNGRRLVVVFLLLLVGGTLFADGKGAMAATSGCVDSPTENRTLTITQTSTLTGLAPNLAPAAIAGVVTNNSTDSTFVVAIAVSIDAVTKRVGVVGVCEVDDYLLLSPRMPVGLALRGGGSTAFGGASIGFNDRSVNQDACKGATVTLRYLTVD